MSGLTEFTEDSVINFMGGTFELPRITNVGQLVEELDTIRQELLGWAGDEPQLHQIAVQELHMEGNKLSVLLKDGIPQ